MKEWLMYLDDDWRRSADANVAEILNPASGDCVARVHQASIADAGAAVEAASRALPAWQERTPTEREALLLAVAAEIERRRNDFVDLLVDESGCTFGVAHYQVGYAAMDLTSAAAECRRAVGETLPSDVPGLFSMTIRRPVGVIVGITPFNMALAIPVLKLSRALALGNTYILKPAEDTPAAALLLAEAFHSVGFPPGVLNVLPGGADVGQALIQAPAVGLVSFTGSTSVGKRIAQQAASHLKRVSLEMGGNNAMIVLKDADLDYAVQAACFGSFNHAGQACIASGRLLIAHEVYSDFYSALAARAQGLKVGDPRDPETVIGPLIRPRECVRVLDQVQDACAAGAKVVTGGRYQGSFFEPTVVRDVAPDSSLFQEETFGPVAAVTPIRDLEEGIRLANATTYGLTAAVMTNDLNAAMEASRSLRVGMVHINGTTVQSEPMAPFGGVKDSGLGREGGPHAAAELTETLWVTAQSGHQAFPF